MAMLKERYDCPYFRILIIGRANAGKTTILEKVCGVAKGSKPIIYDEHGVKITAKRKLVANIKQLLGGTSVTHLNPSMEVSHVISMGVSSYYISIQRGIHNIEDQITYLGSNFIFHDSQGFEAGSSEEINIVWRFIEERSATTELRDQLHAIWCLCFIPLLTK